MYTFCHVPCNSYTKTRKTSFWDHLATKSGQIGHRPWGGGRSDAQRSYGSGWLLNGHFITFWSRSGHVLSRSRHRIHFGILIRAMQCRKFYLTLANVAAVQGTVSMRVYIYCTVSQAAKTNTREAWRRIPLTISLLRLRSDAFYRMIWPSPYIIVYVLMRSGQPYW